MKKLLLALAALVLTACSANPGLPAVPGTVPAPTALPSQQAPIPPPTATPTPAPTPIPGVRIATADHALFDGDFDSARSEYNLALQGSNDPAMRSAAMWGLSRTEYQAGNYSLALDLLRNLVAQYPQAAEAGWAYFLMGKTFQFLDRQSEAATAYQQYLTLRPGLLDGMVNELRGDALEASSDYNGALQAYRTALCCRASRRVRGRSIQRRAPRA